MSLILAITIISENKHIDNSEIAMTSYSNGQTAIIRTERGLTISGTRITLYDVMDYVTEQYPPKFIRAKLELSS